MASNDLKLVFFYFGNLASSENEIPEDVQIGYFKYSFQNIWNRLPQMDKCNLNKFNFILQNGFDRNYFNVPVNWFLSERGKLLQWNEFLKITQTKYFDQVAILNKAKGVYYAFKIGDSTPYAKKYLCYSADNIIEHGRNQQTKENLMLIEVTSHHGSTTYVYFGKGEPSTIKIDVHDEVAVQDTHVVRIIGKDGVEYQNHLQSSSISKGDLQVLLQTQIPKENKYKAHDAVRKSKPQSIVGSFPIAAYNIGIQKLVIQTYLSKGTRMIYSIQENENFVDFIEFNSLKDLGFNIKGLRVEACSRFAFLTLDKNLQKMFVNIFFIDPYYCESEICLFKSKQCFVFDCSQTKDVIVKSIMYDKAGSGVKLLLQQPDYIHRFTLEETEEDMIPNDKGKDTPFKIPEFESEADEYASSEENMTQGFNQVIREQKIVKSQHDCSHCTRSCPQTPMLLSKAGNIYYLVDQLGMTQVVEINPLINCLNNEVVVMEKKEKCCRLHIQGDVFYYMTPLREIIKLQMQYDNHMLVEIKQLSLQVKDRPNFIVQSNENTIITDKYIIQGQKIFYLLDNEKSKDNNPYIMNMEFLSRLPDLENPKEHKEYLSGPYKITGSDYFMCIFKYGNHHTKGEGIFKQKIYQLPDSQNTPMVQDINQVVQMSTFLNEEQILVAIDRRYMLFNKWGQFNQCIQFKGQDDEGQPMIVDRLNMDLLQVSGNQSFYLFEDQTQTYFSVYALVMDSKQMIFVLVFNVDLKKYLTHFKPSQPLSVNNQDGDKTVQKDLTNEGQVNVSYCTTTHYAGRCTDVQIRVWLFNNPACTRSSFNHISQANWNAFYVKKTIDESVQFPDRSITNVYTFLDTYCEQIQSLKDIEDQHQKSLPFIFKNKAHIDYLHSLIDYIQGRYAKVACVHILGDLIFVSCGRFIQYGQFDLNAALNLKFPSLVFNPNVEIYQIRKTTQKNIIQIVTKNGVLDELTILTWDFNRDIEHSIFQVLCDKSIRPERHVIKGLVEKCNYFVSQKEIFDLDFSIPVQQISRSTKSMNHRKDLVIRSKKLYIDGSRYLGLVSQNELRFPITRMDLLFWINVFQTNTAPQTIIKLLNLEDLRKIYKDKSLFHHFGSNLSMITEIHNKYFNTIHHTQSIEDELMPLTLLFPDSKGLTSLDHALQKKRPKVFEMMLDMIRLVKNNFTFSKMMLPVFSQMIQEESQVIYKFFDDCIFQPVYLQQPVIMRWPDGLDEFICARPSSLITVYELESYLIDEGLLPHQTHEQISNDANDASIKSATATQSEYRSSQLKIVEDDDTSFLRVNIEILAFDWIFEDDNASNMIELLANNATKQLLIQKSNKAFINLMWKNYQPRIFHTQFIPYMTYMLMFTIITQYTSGAYLIALSPADHSSALYNSYLCTRILVTILSTLCLIFVCRGFMNEIKQMVQCGFAYLDDPWNYLDFSTALTSGTYLCRISLISIHGQLNSIGEVTPVFMRAHGAVAAFLVGIKVFYWMRLFSNSAFFIRLIVETLADIKTFMFLMSLILYSFANFFLILNTNDEPMEKYYNVVYGFPMLDALISMYLLSLGEFQIETFSKSANKNIAWIFFLLASFIILLVFMNMLIAIMGSTFSNVYDNQEENALLEQLQLMQDYIWSVDLKEKYSNMKYIVRISPELSSQDQAFSNEDDPIYSLNETICRQMVDVNGKLDNIINSQRKQKQ